MPFTATDPPLLQDENANELGKWMKTELERLAASFEAPDLTAYKVLHVEPGKPREGQVVVADGSDWNPGAGAGQYMYIGGAWVFQRSGPEPVSYGVVTDGTNPATANGSGATFKLRGADGVKVTTTNNDGTHGDNALHEMDIINITTATPALGDYVPLADVSASNVIRRATMQQILDLIGGLSTESAPDILADFLALYDASGTVAKKVAITKLGKQLISTTALTSGTGVNITLPSGYSEFELHIRSFNPASAFVPQLRFSQDGGSTFVTCTYAAFGSAANESGVATSTISLVGAGINTDAKLSGVVNIIGNTHNNHKFARTDFVYEHNIDLKVGVVRIDATAPLDTIRFQMSSGNLSSGNADLWGIV